MSVTAALSNVFSSLDRHRARYASDRVDTSGDGGGGGAEVLAEVGGESSASSSAAAAAPSSSSPSPRPQQQRHHHQPHQQRRESPSAAASVAAALAAAQEQHRNFRRRSSGSRRSNGGRSSVSRRAAVVGENAAGEDDEGLEDVALEEGLRAADGEGGGASAPEAADEADEESRAGVPDASAVPIFAAAAAATGRNTMTLAELEDERELARRRSSVVVLLAAFVLFRLWVMALQEGDVGILMLCLVGTSWTARWISYNRDREEELDRRIANYLEHSEPGTTEVDRNDLRMLSFQAQLALAIMESQRQMMEGGYGHPDGGDQNTGVSDEARSRWSRFKYKDEEDDSVVTGEGKRQRRRSSQKGKYGSVSQKDDGLQEDGPHCSICLSEYETGDDIVQLPCNHLYHDECISSWTSNHVKCPLCNFDLESVSGAADGSSSTISSSHPADSIV